MKQLKIIVTVVAFLAIIIWAASASAQELSCWRDSQFVNLPQIEIPCPPSPRVVVDAGYALGNLRVTREYPEGRGLVNGEKLASDGLEISARVRATDIVTVGYRHEHTGLRNAMYMATKRMGEDQRYTDFVDGKAQYRELYGSFTLPRTRGHALIVGVAGTSMEYDVEYQTLVFAPPLPGRGEREAEYLGTKNVNAWFRTSYFGLVVGGEGRQNLDELTFDYAARWQPRSLRKNDRESSEKENEYDALDQTATGTELRGGVTWNFAEHVGLNVTGELQRLKTPGENRYYIDENQTIKKVTVGIRLSF